MRIRPLYFSDEIFYWARSGRQATVIELHCTFAQKVDPEVLEKALSNALQVHQNFRSRPVIVRGRFQVMDEEVKRAPLYARDGRKRQLGTADTEGLMFYAVYGERDVALHVFHGLSDLRGIIAFLNTVLKCYYHGPGQSGAELPATDCTDTLPCYETVIETLPGHPAGPAFPDKGRIFHLPEKTFGKSTTKQRIFKIDLPLEPLLAIAKRSKSSVVPTLQAFIGRAIRKTYKVGDKTIAGYTTVDLRPVFRLKTSGNASSRFSIPYTKSLDRRDLDERARLLRKYLDMQTQPEVLSAGVKKIMNKALPVIRAPLPMGWKIPLIVNGGRKMDRSDYTFGLTYAGKVCFDQAVDPCITSVSTSVGSYSYPLWFMVSEFHGTLRMLVIQNYHSDRLVKNIFRELAQEIPGMSFLDLGCHEYDEFHWKNLRRM